MSALSTDRKSRLDAGPPALDTNGVALRDERAVARLRWRCRRGMLENDLILARFLDARATTMTNAEVAALDGLLELPDNDLWDLVSGRTEPQDPAFWPLLRELRAA